MRWRSAPWVACIAVGVGLGGVACSGTPSGRDGHLLSALEQATDVGVDGASVSVITGDGDAITAVHGVSNGGGTRVREDTRFAIASVTKTFVMVFTLRLVEDGRLDLDEPVAVTGLHPATTLRHLLGHTSGLRYEAIPPGPSWNAVTLAAALDRPQLCAPGSCFSYSDLGFVVVGHVLERETGMPLRRLLLGIASYDAFGITGWGHSGSTGAELRFYPESRFTVAVLTTRPGSGFRLLGAATQAFPELEA